MTTTKTTKTTYTIHLYDTAEEIGTVDLTAEQYAAYLIAADGDAKVCRLSDLPAGARLSELVNINGNPSVYLME